MGKAKAAKKSTRDILPNRRYVVVTFAAATTTVAYTSFDTMMGAREGAGWLISRLDIMSRDLAGANGWQTAAAGVRFQLCTGAQTALLNADDDEVIASLDVVCTLQTSGCDVTVFPVTWLGPILVASRQLTCAMQGTDDVAPLQAQDFLFVIWYQWVQLTAREWVEIAEGRGIA